MLPLSTLRVFSAPVPTVVIINKTVECGSENYPSNAPMFGKKEICSI